MKYENEIYLAIRIWACVSVACEVLIYLYR